MFIARCPECSNCGCDCGKLPFTVTATVTGVTSNKIKVAPQIAGSEYSVFFPCDFIAVACFGSGAAARPQEPGGCNVSCPENEYCGYGDSDGGPLSGFIVTSPGSCYAKLGRVEPTLYASCRPKQSANEDGEGCDEIKLKVNLGTAYTTCSGGRVVSSPEASEDCDGFEEPTCQPNLQFWYVDSIEIEGTTKCGYEDEQDITIAVAQGDTIYWDAEWELVSVDGVPSFARPKNSSGDFPPERDPKNGRYFRESKEAPAYVAKVKMEPQGCYGSGSLEVWGVVDDDPDSDTFGQVTGVNVVSGGDDYLVYEWAYACRRRYNNQQITLRAVDPHKLITFEPNSCFGTGACIEANEAGDREPPEELFLSQVSFFGGTGCNGNFGYTLSKIQDEDGNDAWELASVSASGGKYFLSGSASVSLGDQLCGVVDSEPSVFLTASGGAITGISILNPGVFYIEKPYDGSVGPVKAVEIKSPGEGYAKLGRYEPLLKVSIDGGGFRIALPDFTPQIKKQSDKCGVDYWEVEDVTIGQYGTLRGRVRLLIDPENPDDEEPTIQQKEAKVYLVVERDEEGNVTNEYVDVSKGGEFYRESKNLPPYVTGYTMDVRQAYPSKGSGAEISIKIDDDPFSPTFGTVTEAKVVQGGSGYTVLGGPKYCRYIAPGTCGLSYSTGDTTGWGSVDGVPGVRPPINDIPGIGGLQGAKNAAPGFSWPQGTDCEGNGSCLGQLGINTGFDLSDFGQKSCDDRGNATMENAEGVKITFEPGGLWKPCRQEDTPHDCGYCPDFRKLCFTATGTDWSGATETMTSEDCDISPVSAGLFFNDCAPFAGGSGASGTFKCIDIGTVLIGCRSGKITVSASGGPSGGFYAEGCPEHDNYPFEECGGCTSWSGDASVECTESSDWYSTTLTIVLEYDDPFWCGGCPPPGSVTVTITKC